MKICPNCGASLSEDSRFCTVCGKEYPQKAFCGHCGALVDKEDVFCEQCGNRLGKEPDAYLLGYQDEEPSKNILVPIIAGLLLLAMIGGGWWYYFNSTKSSPMDNNVVTTDSIAGVDSVAVSEAVEEIVTDTVVADTIAADISQNAENQSDLLINGHKAIDLGSSEGLYDEDGNPINVQGELFDPLEEGEADEEEGKPVTFEDL